MDRYQVRKGQRPVELFLACVQFFCIFNNRKRTGHPLISASRIDDNRKFTAIHSGI